ncbi:MAG TPA: DNA polymerase III subunit beta, partial [Acidimicrobiia bacterium]|nr:DNA polymerase III subunit beta [Acidimicrobiia bacterium]
MKFRCERDTLADAVATAQRAVASRTGAMPVLSGLRLTLTPGSLELVGTDLELTIRVRVPADTDGEGSAVVPARLFSEIVRQLEGDTVSVELADDDARIEAGRFATTLRTLSAAEFPRLPEVSEGGVRVEAAAFAEALRQVVPGASRDDARPILTGVLLTASAGGLRLVATDSYRLALRDLQGVSMLEEGQKVLVAAKGLGEVQRLLSGETGDIDVVLGEREVVFRVGGTEVTTRLIEGDFPNYQQLIPSGYPNRLTVARDALQAAVNRVRLVGQSKDTAPIRLGMTAEGLELSAIAQDVGEAHESVEAKYEGTDLTVAFNSQFLLDGIDAAASDEVVIESIDP